MAEGVFREDMIPIATIPTGKTDEHEFRLVVRAHRAQDGIPARIEVEDETRALEDDESAWIFSGAAISFSGSIVDDLIVALVRAKAQLAKRATTLPAPPPDPSPSAAADTEAR